MPRLIDFDPVFARLTEAVRRYEKTAPAAARYFNDLFVRLGDSPEKVVLSELLFLDRLVEEGVWMAPDYAANGVLHLLDRLGRDTAGLLDF